MERKPNQRPSINPGTGEPGGSAANEPGHLRGYQTNLRDEKKGLIPLRTEKPGCLAAAVIIIRSLVGGDKNK